MQSVRLHAYGNLDQLKIENTAGLNPVDQHVIEGWMQQYAPLDLPAILGADAAGTIISAGPDVAEFTVGDDVIAYLSLNGRGAFAEEAVASVANVARLPASLSFEEGATLPLAA